MEITLSQAQAVLSSPIFVMKLPPAVSYKFAKLGKLLSKEMEGYETERRKLIEAHGGVLNDAKTEFIFEKEEDRAAFQKDLADLLETSVDIGTHFPMPLPDREFTPSEILALEPLFVLDEAPRP